MKGFGEGGKGKLWGIATERRSFLCTGNLKRAQGGARTGALPPRSALSIFSHPQSSHSPALHLLQSCVSKKHMHVWRAAAMERLLKLRPSPPPAVRAPRGGGGDDCSLMGAAAAAPAVQHGGPSHTRLLYTRHPHPPAHPDQNSTMRRLQRAGLHRHREGAARCMAGGCVRARDGVRQQRCACAGIAADGGLR